MAPAGSAPRANRITNISVSLVDTASVLVVHRRNLVSYLIGSAVKAVFLLAIARTAWDWLRR